MCDSLRPENRVHSNCWLIQDEKFWILKESCSQRHSALLTTTATSKINQSGQQPQDADERFSHISASLCMPFSGDEPAWPHSGTQQSAWCGRMEHVWLTLPAQNLNICESDDCHHFANLPRFIWTRKNCGHEPRGEFTHTRNAFHGRQQQPVSHKTPEENKHPSLILFRGTQLHWRWEEHYANRRGLRNI